MQHNAKNMFWYVYVWTQILGCIEVRVRVRVEVLYSITLNFHFVELLGYVCINYAA